MTHDEYAGLKAVNFSSLKHLAVSPLEYRWRIDHPEPRKEAFVIGGAIHCMLLEPGKFTSRYAVFDGTRRGKAWEDWQAQNPDAESIKPDQEELIGSCVKAIMAHRVAAPLIKSARAEEPITWTDPDTGLACKGRLDGILSTTILDLKSTRNIAPDKFRKSIADYLYHGQLAWYWDGAIAAGKVPAGGDRPFIIAVQNGPPFDVGVYQLTEQALTTGRLLYQSLLRQLVICMESDIWPGVAPDVVQMDLPRWAEVQPETDEEVFE